MTASRGLGVVARAPVILILLLLVAGCASGPKPLATKSAEGAPLVPVPSLPGRIDFSKCDEVNVLLSGPMDRLPVAPMLTPKATDPARTIGSIVLTAMRCEEVGTNRTTPMAFFTLVPVEPHPKAPIANASSVYYLANVASVDPAVIDAFGGLVAVVENHTVDVGFTDVGAWPQARGAFRVQAGARPVLAGETVMAGPPRDGQAGKLGVYAFQGGSLTRHLVEFSKYRGYPNGQATLTDSAGTPHAGFYDGLAITAGSHNLGYDVSFVLNRTAVKWT